ncbi:MAG: transcription termination/antitermination factor NusG [Candidatus Marinimicrobia bacterium]|nr:transcription termination/antitermination factor NusG [Candidatus Neomarinimicrobiota bacterium]MBL7059745.1 transcription termination/antitermination factor NusG [Candidatus Neomarinimicrobiota bacterium]
MEWYSLRVISGKEEKIKETILKEVEINGFQESVPEVLVPTENIVEMRDGKKKVKTKVFFPGYILIKMDMNKETQYVVENVNGVINFIGTQGKPGALKPEEINRIIGVVESADGREVVDVPFKVGDAIKVVDGPFSDFSGFVQEVNKDKQKLKVSVSIFGRPTPIELDFLQVELEK